jgi:integrase
VSGRWMSSRSTGTSGRYFPASVASFDPVVWNSPTALSCLCRRRHNHDVRHSYATAGRNAKIDWKALSKRIGHADVAFTMKQYVQTDLEADRQVANTLAGLTVGGLLVTEVDAQAN